MNTKCMHHGYWIMNRWFWTWLEIGEEFIQIKVEGSFICNSRWYYLFLHPANRYASQTSCLLFSLRSESLRQSGVDSAAVIPLEFDIVTQHIKRQVCSWSASSMSMFQIVSTFKWKRTYNIIIWTSLLSLSEFTLGFNSQLFVHTHYCLILAYGSSLWTPYFFFLPLFIIFLFF